MTLSVALTGNIASGKSMVATRWTEAGVPVVSADELSREAVAPGSDGLAAVVESFGSDVLDAEGRLDRGRLRDIVFRDDEARRRLEEIVHPFVWASRERWLAERKRERAPLVVSEIPLLFESGREDDFDLIVLVDAPERVRLERLVAGRGLDPDEAARMIAAQIDTDRKRARSDWVIDNVGTVEDLHAAADRVLSELRARTGAGPIRIDLHLHTRGSWDCLSDPERLLERAIECGFSRIAMTDHNRVHVALEMAEKYPDRVIVGEEVRTAEGVDVIGLYLSEEIPEGTPGEETIERIHAQGGVAYLPHPFAGGKGGGGAHAERLGRLCDVIEVFNARLHHAALNVRAEQLADRLDKLRGAGSDAHTVGELGNAWVELPAHANRADALLVALHSARTGGREASRAVHLASTWAKVRKRLPGSTGGR